MPIIQATNLTKSYQVHQKIPGVLGSLRGLFAREYTQVKAVADLSFSIDPGELVGFIGPNGAGKTTTLKMLSGLLYPTKGTVRVLGHNPWLREQSFLKQISLVMGQKNQLWWDLPAIESFNLARDIYNIPGSKYKQTLHTLVDMLAIGDVLNVQVRKLSLGQRMKAELVAALIHEPKVLFLDEPTIGLDVVMQKTMRTFIKEYNKEYQGAILLTSHYMDDVKELCKRVIVIDHGKLLYDGLLMDLVHKYAKNKVIEVILDDKDLGKANKFPGYKSTHDSRATFIVPRTQVAATASKLLSTFTVTDIVIKEPEIEDVIRTVFNNNNKNV
jgi:ABC-2 type transport system ATP-binding protein